MADVDYVRPHTAAAVAFGGWYLWTTHGAPTMERLRAVLDALERAWRF